MLNAHANSDARRLQRYVHVVRDGEAAHLVNLLTRGSISVDGSALEALEAWLVRGEQERLHAIEDHEGFLQALEQGLYLVPLDFDEKAYIQQRFSQDRNNRQTLSLVISPTVGCNLACHYCFERKAPGVMTEAVSDELVHLVESLLRGYRSLHVQWFGGEPLLALPLLEKLSRQFIHLCAQSNKRYTSEIITNGVHLTKEVADTLMRSGVSDVQVTLEGMREFHDKVRRSRAEPATFDRILNNVASASDVLSFSLRMHVTPYNEESLHRLLDHLSTTGLAQRVKKACFAPLFDFRQRDGERIFGTAPARVLTVESFAAVQVRLLRHARAIGLPLADFLEASYALCSAASTGTLVVNPNGSLAKCYLDAGDDGETIGDVRSGVIAQSNNAHKWSDYDFLKDEECSSCSFLPLCMGGCPKQKMLDAPKTQVCTPLKYNLAERTNLQFEGVASRA